MPNVNDTAVIVCDVLSTVCLGLLATTSIAGVTIGLTPWEAVLLFFVGKSASTVLQHLAPVGSKRVG